MPLSSSMQAEPQSPGPSLLWAETLPTALAATWTGAATSASAQTQKRPYTSQHSLIYGGRYAVSECIGRGGSGTVYRAHDLLLDGWVALKVMHKDLCAVPQAVASFQREVRLARRVSHPNVVDMFDSGEDHDSLFLTMKLVEGDSLRNAMRKSSETWPLERVAAIGMQICRGLDAMHACGVIHCDLKPDNVLLTSDGRAVITDFGIAREIAPSDALLELDRSAGTPEYIAPEQVMEAPTFDGRVDLYAMGILLYELLTGALPFVGTTPILTAAARLMRSPPDPRERRPELSIWWAKAVLRCLARNPEERYQSATELARVLQSLPLC